MRSLVIYDSMFGDTEKVAKALASGVRARGIEVDCTRAAEVDVGDLRAYDMLVIGGPIHKLGLSATMTTFLNRLKDVDVQGVKGFTFDTRLKSRFAGSAGKRIERK